MAKGVPVDLELKRAFAELHEKMMETSKKIQSIDSQISVYKRHLEMATICQQEIASLPPGTRTYESVARMFLLTDIFDVMKNINTRNSQITARTTELKNNKLYLEKSLRESKDNLREMVQHRKDQS